MARDFIGSATHKLDAKGRVSLPAEFRDVLRDAGAADNFVLIPADEDEPMHVAMTASAHSDVIARLDVMEFDSWDEEQSTRERYIGNARRISVEEGGRFVLSRDLREALGLTDQVRFRGDGGTFQLWRPEEHDARFAPAVRAKPKRLRLAGIGR